MFGTVVKIGFTTDHSIDRRLAAIQMYCPLPLAVASEIQCRYTGYTERRVQLVCEPARLHGEWFTVTPLVRRFIDAGTEEALLAICDEVQTPVFGL